MSDQHQFNVDHARQYGLREAVLIHNLHFWVGYHHANGTNCYDEKTWTYNSVKAFEDLFPYLTYKQIRTSLDTLVTLDVLVRGHHSKNPSDRTSWFAFTDSFLASNPLPSRANGLPSRANGDALQGKSLEGTDSKHRLKTKEVVAPAPSTFILPDWINQEHWGIWRNQPKHRKATDAQKQLAVTKLGQWRDAGLDYATALENSAMNGWQGLFPPEHNQPIPGRYTNRNDQRAATLAGLSNTGEPNDHDRHPQPDDQYRPRHGDIFEIDARFVD